MVLILLSTSQAVIPFIFSSIFCRHTPKSLNCWTLISLLNSPHPSLTAFCYSEHFPFNLPETTSGKVPPCVPVSSLVTLLMSKRSKS